MDSSMKRVTRADVARFAGVSETIVSYVVNNNRYVDKAKRALVEAAIRELDYRPNRTARMLKGKKSHHIVFIADQIVNEHFSLLISEMERYAYGFGYMISVCANRDSAQFVSEVVSRQYDGIVISSISFPEGYIRQFIDARIPVVLLVNRDYSAVDGAGKINTGLYDGARECVRHLAGRDRRNILYLDRFSKRGHFSTMDDMRLRGFMEQARACGQLLAGYGVLTGCRDENEVAEKLRQRMEAEPGIDAIFGRNDVLACIAIRTMQEIGISVPKDIAVIGFDNSSLSKYTNPTLTTMEMPRAQIGRAAVEMLMQMIGHNAVPEPVSFSTRLVVRQST